MPLTVTTATVIALYGVPDLAVVAVAGVGLIAITALYVGVSLTAATLVPSQAGVAAIGLAVFALPSVVGGIFPGLTPSLPTSIGSWVFSAALGGTTPIATPIAWLVTLWVLFLVARRWFASMEL